MTTSNISTTYPFIASQYETFNQLFQEANQPNIVKGLDTYVFRLLNLRTELESQLLGKKGLISDKITTVDILKKDINTKICIIIEKSLMQTPSWVSNPAITSIDPCVGFVNQSNNCWVIAMLQVCLHMNHLKEALITVGQFFKTGNSFDQQLMKKVLSHFDIINPLNITVEEVVLLYNKIKEPIFKLNILYTLKKKSINPQVLIKFPCPIEYQVPLYAIVNEGLTKKKLVPTSEEMTTLISGEINRLLEDPKNGLNAKQVQLKEAGRALTDVIETYHTHTRLRHAVPSSVAQNVRIAFYHLFGTRQIFSPDASTSEDALEALTSLMTAYEMILKLNEKFPPDSYVPLETRRYYKPLGDPILPDPEKTYSSPLTHNLFSSEVHFDHQILLTLPQEEGTFLDDLLKSNCTSRDSGDGVYLLADGRIQNYECDKVCTFFHKKPLQLSLALNRFNRNGNQYQKNNTQICAQRLIAAPPEMTSFGTYLAYSLDAFVVHSGIFQGGHYIAYRKVSYLGTDGNVHYQWREGDDSRIRYVDEQEIDKILNGKTRMSQMTPYFFYFTLVPEKDQDAMLSVVFNTRPPSDKEDRIIQSYYRQKQFCSFLKKIYFIIQKDTTRGKLHETLARFNQEFAGYPRLIHSLFEINDQSHSSILGPTIVKMRMINSLERLGQVIDREERMLLIAERFVLLKKFQQFCQIIFSNSKEMGRLFFTLFQSFPKSLKEQIQEWLIKDDTEKKSFEESLKNDTFQIFIQNIITTYPQRDLHLLIPKLKREAEQSFRLELQERSKFYASFFLRSLTFTINN